jgi:glycosyltransferase involved in cell wall biosynthesis
LTSARPRLALLHYTAHPVTGGVESVMEEHRRLLAAAGYPVTVIAGRGEAVIVPEVDSRRPETSFDELRERLVQTLAPLLREIDVVIAHNVLTMPFNLPLIDVLPKLGRPLIAWTHDIAWVNPRYAEFRRDEWPYRLLHEPAPGARYVAISDLRREQLEATYGVAAPVIPNGVDAGRLLRLRPATVELLRRAGSWQRNPIVLVPLRVTRRKRLEDALEVAARLRPRQPQLGWIVSGPLGPHQADNREYWEHLRELRSRLGLEDVFAFLHEFGQGDRHPVDDEMMAELYALAGAVFLPSESEGFGLPVIEAALTKTPLVCTDIAAFAELEAERRYPTGDLAAAAGLLEATLAGSPQARAREGFTWEAIFPKIEGVIADAVA